MQLQSLCLLITVGFQLGLWLMDVITAPLSETSALRGHLLDSAAHMRLMTMGLLMLLMLRFAPQGLIPEKKR